MFGKQGNLEETLLKTKTKGDSRKYFNPVQLKLSLDAIDIKVSF